MELGQKVSLEGYEWEDLTAQVETVNDSSRGGWQTMLSDLNNVPPKVDSDEIIDKLKQSGQWEEKTPETETKTEGKEAPKTESTEPAAPAAPSVITPKQKVAAQMYMQSFDMLFAGGAAMITKNAQVYELAKARDKDLAALSLMLGECFAVYNIDPEPWIPFVGFLTATYGGKSYEIFSFLQENKGKDNRTVDEKIKELQDELKLAELRAKIREAGKVSPTPKKSATAPEIKPEGEKRRGNPHNGTGKKTGPKPKN